MNDFSTKRKRDDVEPDSKKTKNYLDDEARALYTTSNEWPIYNHPEGGIMKITPWGILRQYPNPTTGEMMTKFEDSNFQDVSFKSNLDNIYAQPPPPPPASHFPTTPQSLYPNSHSDISSPSPGFNATSTNATTNTSNNDFHNPGTDRIKLSPSDEAELYVMDGYENQAHDNSNQFYQEQENYLGMAADEFEYDDSEVEHHHNNFDSDVMM